NALNKLKLFRRGAVRWLLQRLHNLGRDAIPEPLLRLPRGEPARDGVGIDDAVRILIEGHVLEEQALEIQTAPRRVFPDPQVAETKRGEVVIDRTGGFDETGAGIVDRPPHTVLHFLEPPLDLIAVVQRIVA